VCEFIPGGGTGTPSLLVTSFDCRWSNIYISAFLMPFIGVDWVPSAMSRQLSARNRSCKARKKTKPSRKRASFSPTALVKLSQFIVPKVVVALNETEKG
jgi:hypothetical protein